jgi:[protein-PII] uridylyltransferase
MTTLDGYVLNSFQVLEQSGEAIHELFREIHICNALRQNLQQRVVSGHKNIHTLSRQAKHFPIPTTVTFQTDPLNRYSIIELVSTDRAGLLSQVGLAFVEQGVYLHNAKITTIGARVEDMFYVTDKNEQLISDSAQQARIRLAIMNALESE